MRWKGDAPDGLDIPPSHHDLCVALHRDRTVFRALHDRVVALGEQATMDAIAICGYCVLAMVQFAIIPRYC